MADKWPLATGNWSNAANWNDGTKPVSGDTVYADGKTLTIDENIDIGNGLCTTETRSGGTAGGSFVLNNNRTIVANFRAGSTTCISSWGTGVNLTGNIQGSLTSTARHGCLAIGNNSTITGNIIAGSQSDSYGVSNYTGSGVVVNGNIQGGPGGGPSCPGISTFSGQMIVNGNVLGGGHVSNDQLYQNYGINQLNAGANLVVNGNLNTPTSTVAAIRIAASGSFSITVNGNAYAGTQSNNSAIRYTVTTATGNVVINGSVYAKGADGINFNGTGSLIVTGDAVAGYNGYGVANYSTGGTVRVYGTAVGNDWGLGYTSNGGFAGVYGGGTNAGVVETITSVRSVRHGANGQAGVAGRVFLDVTSIATSSVKMRGNPTSFTEYTLATAENLGSLPSNSDVRLGTVFNFGTRTGTLAVPPAASVAIGVPVDNTVGTAAITAASISSALADEFASVLSAIGNIEVDNAAIALAVETQLADDFSTVNTNLAAVGLAVVDRPTLIQIEASTILAKESNATSNKTEILTAVGNIEVDNVAIAQAVETQLADDFQDLADAIEGVELDESAIATSVFQLLVGSGVARYALPTDDGTVEAIRYVDFDLDITTVTTAADSKFVLTIGCEGELTPYLVADSETGLVSLQRTTEVTAGWASVERISSTLVRVYISANAMKNVPSAEFLIELRELTTDGKVKLRYERPFVVRSGAGRTIE